MEIDELVSAMNVIELSGNGRSDVIRELVEAMDWAGEGVSSDKVIEAIEEREYTAQTIIGKGLALPHAVIDWDGNFRIVLGRSRDGVDYGTSGDKLHLVLLLVVGKGCARTHLQVLATAAGLLIDYEFRQSLVNARDVRGIRRLLVEQAERRQPKRRGVDEHPPRSVAVVQQAIRLAESLSAQALLIATDHCRAVPWQTLAAWSGRLLIVAARSADDHVPDQSGLHLFDVPHATLSRFDRANLGLLLAASNGLVDHERDVVCITGPRGQALDSITVTRLAAHFRGVFGDHGNQTTRNVALPVILRVLSLAIELASEGREAHPIGAMFVIGDTRHVMRHTQQLVLNPFHGFSRRLRNIVDPSLTETIKEFALLDGAFIVEADGSIRSAGTYLIPAGRAADLPGGLGARHQAAAGITADTRAIAVAVSQSTGTVTLFQGGRIVLSLERATPTRW